MMPKNQKVTIGLISTLIFQAAFYSITFADEEEKIVKNIAAQYMSESLPKIIPGTQEALKRQEIARESYMLFTCSGIAESMPKPDTTPSAQ